MIDFYEVTKAFQGDALFEKISFKIHKGEKCGLVGRNGSGKTTLFRLMMGEELPDSGQIAKPKNYKLGYLQQHVRFTAGTLLEEASLSLPIGEEDQTYKVEKILFGLGFKEEDLVKPISAFSGGYHLRLHLAKVLVSEPDCLLLDEPTNFLDILSIRWLTRFLQSWKKELVLVSHDREFLDQVITHTLGIHRKRISKISGGTSAFFSWVVEEEERHERMRANIEKQKAHAEAFIQRFGAKATKAAQAQSRLKAIARLPALEKLAQIENLHFSFQEAPFPGKILLKAENVQFSYALGDPLLIPGLSLEIEKGDRIAIIGKNGYGKSTLLRLLQQELSPLSGKLQKSENALTGYFGQTHIQRLNSTLSIEEEISAANPLLNFTEVRHLCGAMMFSGDKAKKRISVLSGGEKSRVLLGKILATPCNLLLLDEPTNHLDMESIEAMMAALDAFSGAVVMVTHSEYLLHSLSFNKIIACHRQEQRVFLGDYEDFLTKIGWQEESSFKIKSSSGHEDRAQKAKWIEERSRVLLPLKKEMDRLEIHLNLLEAHLSEQQAALLEAAAIQEGRKISELSKSIAEKKKEIDQVLDQLEQVLIQYEDHKKGFDQKLEMSY